MVAALRNVSKLEVFCILSVLVLMVFIVPFIIHSYISLLTSTGKTGITDILEETSNVDHLEFTKSKTSQLHLGIEELKNIKASVNAELRQLENKRQTLIKDVNSYSSQLEKIKTDKNNVAFELQQLITSLQNQKIENKEQSQKNDFDIKLPKQILTSMGDVLLSPTNHKTCHMFNCFDYSRCSVLSRFPVYVYDMDNSPLKEQTSNSDTYQKFSKIVSQNIYITQDPENACIYLVLLEFSNVLKTHELENFIRKLPYWNGDGRNHVLISFSKEKVSLTDYLFNVSTGRAIIAQSSFTSIGYRPQFDIIIPIFSGILNGDLWPYLASISPARRLHLLTYHGQYLPDLLSSNFPEVNEKTEINSLPQIYYTILSYLQQIQNKYSNSMYLFKFNCERIENEVLNDWNLCDSSQARKVLLRQSTFVLIIAPIDQSFVSTSHSLLRLHEAFENGAIPIILGNHLQYPFSELIQWHRAIITLPYARITELPFLVQTITDADILDMRHQGRLIWERYLGSMERIMNTLLSIIRRRLNIPAFPISDVPTLSVFNSSFSPIFEDIDYLDTENEEILGPLEVPFSSPKFLHNFSSSYKSFHDDYDPFHLYPFTPFESVFPAEAKFMGSNVGFRPINNGAGGAGKEFYQSLGGNVPREQFTVVLLTYERDAVLINSLTRLNNLPYLNKVLVIWNNPRPPAEDIRWPYLNVPLHVVKTTTNSLNNRFLPYDLIETEAILSLDDDTHLRKDEIVFGFRVWREERDRLVGFPGRFHAWDVKSQSWVYNSNYSCELSMILTGAAFFHKYYAYAYSYIMPQAIRDKVDDYMNCEDIAMNFLISHITRKPPIKVTSRWTFHCVGCSETLSEDDSHFNERHKCINYFAKVYGYMPLLNTQFRVDSVLFKTRIPVDKAKCFQFV